MLLCRRCGLLRGRRSVYDRCQGSWAKDIKVGFSTINAMAETVDTKPVFREAFKRRRCLVAIEAFYEWKKLSPKERQPMPSHSLIVA